MRICFIGHQSTKEGAPRFLLDQVDFLLSKRIEVFVVLPSFGLLTDALAQRGVPYTIIPSPWWTKEASDGKLDYAATLDSALEMAKIFLEWKIDIVYTHTLVAPAGPIAAALAGKPHVWHIHEFAYNPDCVEMAIPKKSLAQLMNQTSNIIVFNSFAVEKEWHGLFQSGKTMVVYNWASPSPVLASESSESHACKSFDQAPSQFVMAVVGTITPWKRQMDALQAVLRLVKAGYDVMLLVVGPVTRESYRNELADFVRQNALTERIQFCGYIENPMVLMKSAKVTLVCSRLEPFGRVTIESMLQGVPVIGADSGGTSEIIQDSLNGLLFPLGDIDALTACIIRLIQDEPLRKRLASNSISRGLDFSSADKAMAPLLGQFARLADAKNPSYPLLNYVWSGMVGCNLDGPMQIRFRLVLRMFISIMFKSFKRSFARFLQSRPSVLKII